MSLHIGAKAGEIAETVLLPGDPLRAKLIAESFLTDVYQYSNIRNMSGFTGTYKGKRISVQGGGMGMPSTAIYANELIKEYDVKTIIRVGTCGSLKREISLGEVILAMSANTDSNINRATFNGMNYSPVADFELLDKAYHQARELSIPVRVGGIFSTDFFYDENPDRYEVWANHGVLGVEMESAILYTLAARTNTRALSILTVSDNLITKEFNSAEGRTNDIENTARLALEIV
ncbi:purine-nucleoside phosphorylase [Ekhidna sp.]|uniref:purine-nucleoside phosphorylase n=1 Tax=Ekhidna sp. TaxID=2608089 RepID=UPI003B50B147